ncbi:MULTISPECIES: hypothetical protein [unclassified Flavobacterium]|jgi:uncharacterized membrane protein|uniref:hypothetical protein n=1 Tax=unclassified Flavobacterium TaxID=196869 RepID=UPI0025BC4D78|nr:MULTISPECIES: hypothetical protein [unclassified Flavobacterium]
MKIMIDIIYGLFKFILAICILPTIIIALLILGALNRNGIFNQIIDDLEKICKYFTGDKF